MANERLEGEEQFHSRNYLLKMSRFHAKIHFKIAPQKLNLVIVEKLYQKLLYLRYQLQMLLHVPP